MAPNFKLIIGLGNPGHKYKDTYHNVGYLAIDRLMSELGKTGNQAAAKNHKDFLYLKSSGLIFVRPKTFMNDSGRATGEAAGYFKTKPEEILIVHDDADLTLGQHKLSFGRGSAGHRGVESIINALKTKNFWRFRIGVRQPAALRRLRAARRKAGDLVLKKITKADLATLYSVLGGLTAKVIEKENPEGVA